VCGSNSTSFANGAVNVVDNNESAFTAGSDVSSRYINIFGWDGDPGEEAQDRPEK
jgi:hypothetical protein